MYGQNEIVEHARIAQLVERQAFNLVVVGSSPTSGNRMWVCALKELPSPLLLPTCVLPEVCTPHMRFAIRPFHYCAEYIILLQAPPTQPTVPSDKTLQINCKNKPTVFFLTSTDPRGHAVWSAMVAGRICTDCLTPQPPYYMLDRS